MTNEEKEIAMLLTDYEWELLQKTAAQTGQTANDLATQLVRDALAAQAGMPNQEGRVVPLARRG